MIFQIYNKLFCLKLGEISFLSLQTLSVVKYVKRDITKFFESFLLIRTGWKNVYWEHLMLSFLFCPKREFFAVIRESHVVNDRFCDI